MTARDLCWADVPSCQADVRVFETERMAALAAADSGDDAAGIARGTRVITRTAATCCPPGSGLCFAGLALPYGRSALKLCRCTT